MHRALRAVLPGLLLVAMDGNRADAQQPSARPNIVVIQADDLGYGDLSAYGQAMFQTPALDRLAREGIRFTQYYAGRTVCSPSRTSLMPRSTPAWVSCSSLPPLQPAWHPRGARVAPSRISRCGRTETAASGASSNGGFAKRSGAARHRTIAGNAQLSATTTR